MSIYLTKIKKYIQNILKEDNMVGDRPINFHNDMSNRVNRINIIVSIICTS